MTPTKLTVRGIQYHSGPALHRRGKLKAGAVVELRHEPTNRHDRNAIAVHLRPEGEMLGYVPRELAPRVLELLLGQTVGQITVNSVRECKSSLKVQLKLLVQSASSAKDGDHIPSTLWKNAAELPPNAGVYTIRNTSTGEAYVGSSGNMRKRLTDHLRSLSNRLHSNKRLQNDFDTFGPNRFTVEVSRIAKDTSTLADLEANLIRTMLGQNMSLYNMTEDGQGESNAYSGALYPLTVSDRRNSYKTLSGTRKPIRHKKVIAPLGERVIEALPASDLKKLKSRLASYLAQKAEAVRTNEQIELRNRPRKDRNESNAVERQNYEKRVLEPAYEKWRKISQKIKLHKAGFLYDAFRTTSTIAVRDPWSETIEQITVKNIPEIGHLKRECDEAASQFKAYLTKAPSLRDETIESLVELPTDVIKLKLGGVYYTVDLQNLPIADLHGKINRRLPPSRC